MRAESESTRVEICCHVTWYGLESSAEISTLKPVQLCIFLNRSCEVHDELVQPC